MGDGMRRIAEACGGMRVSAGGRTCDYVAKGKDYKDVIRCRIKQGWVHIGTTDDDRFLQFTMLTSEVERRRL
jgi:hypothetical protein